MEKVTATKVSIEFGPRRKRKPNRIRRRERNSDQASGFDVQYCSCASEIFTWSYPNEGHDYKIGLYGRLGLHCYNFQEGTNYKFLTSTKYSFMYLSYMNYYITLEAMDPVKDSVISFQTLFSDVGHVTADTYVTYTWRTLACRLKCNEALDDEWHLDNAIDEFYTGPMPKWLSDEALATHNKKYYVVQESELHESDWLHSLMEIAFLARAERQLLASPPLEINKVVVETKEDYIREAREKLKAENAIFYISYKYKGVSSEGFAGDHKAIVRKTMDGRPGHMTLETAFERM